ncbi:MAG: hypothetical protein A2104_02340 [Candidatus Melainabacteria bacterium GWF2_32_7]|nr:MAG: hypothetical protein A2104_02340 [Candidatus Melainabacteria bacterium GWF2_32_7]
MLNKVSFGSNPYTTPINKPNFQKNSKLYEDNNTDPPRIYRYDENDKRVYLDEKAKDNFEKG